jgi:hypothetical protein
LVKQNKIKIEQLKQRFIIVCDDIREITNDGIVNPNLQALIKERDNIINELKKINISNTSLNKIIKMEKDNQFKCCLDLIKSKLKKDVNDYIDDIDTRRHKTYEELKKEFEECLEMSTGNFSLKESYEINKALHIVYQKYMIDSSKPTKKERLELLNSRKR